MTDCNELKDAAYVASLLQCVTSAPLLVLAPLTLT
jgi:hypothetical protein